MTLSQDLEWYEEHFGMRGSCYLFSDPRWDCAVMGDTTTVEFTFKHSDDYTLFVLSCGDQ